MPRNIGFPSRAAIRSPDAVFEAHASEASRHPLRLQQFNQRALSGRKPRFDRPCYFFTIFLWFNFSHGTCILWIPLTLRLAFNARRLNIMPGTGAMASPLASEREPCLPSVMEVLTPRAVVCGLLLGCAVCFANMYFGLQAGTVNVMPMQSALIGFAIFRSLRRRLSTALSPMETTIVETIAGALGIAPFTSGYTSFIPALEFLATPEENGPVKFGVPQLLLWSVATCALGIAVAPPFRRLFIFREQLRYPSATATGTLIGVLFRKKAIVARARQPHVHALRYRYSEDDLNSGSPEAESGDEPDRTDTAPSDDFTSSFEGDVGHAVNVLLASLAGSSLFSLASYFIPILRSVPIFGLTAAKDWLWAFDLSPAYFGYGIIIGPSVNTYMLLGAVVGWGILSPVAKYNGWAPGPVDDWNQGSRGWILWVGMGLILGDSAVGLAWVIIKPILPWARRKLGARQLRRRLSQELEHDSLLHGNSATQYEEDTANSKMDDDWASASRVTTSLTLRIGAILLVLYFVSLFAVFYNFVTFSTTLVAVILVPFASIVAMRALGETDNVAALAIGRMAQFIIGSLVVGSSAKSISANLLLAGAVESGSSQAAQQMGNLKTAHMTRTAPRAILFGHLIGSFVGTVIATLVYKIYTRVKQLPSKEFGIPDAHMWLIAARFFYQQGLPERAMGFAMGAFVFGAVFSTLRILGSNRWWRDLVPSGIAMAIGMYIVPAIVLPRALGGLLLVLARDRLGIKSFIFLCSATGLILGQGLFSLVALFFDAIHMPILGN